MHEEKDAILAQNPQQNERKIRLRWLLGLSSLPLFGMVAAFGTAPDTDTQHLKVRTVVENLPLPALTATQAPTDVFWRDERIQRGDTIASLLARLDVNGEDIAAFLAGARDAKTLQQLIPGKAVEARVDENGRLLALRYLLNGDSVLSVVRQGDGFKAVEQGIALETRTEMKSAVIRSSLYGATDAANIPDVIAGQLADIFSSDIDFHQDLRKGDRFSVVYESFYDKGTLVKTGRILAAEFTNQGKTYQAFYFKDRDGHDGYYAADGKNLRKAFLKSPLEFSRVTSGFAMRFHPILKEWKQHKGIDYGAPIGTRVKSVADGTVAFAGSQRGYGNLLVIQHPGRYSTAYGHLKGFAPGIRKGAKVTQGEVVAYVGMTGMSTGPHLHFEFRVDGVQRNPLSVAMPAAFPLAPKYRADFARIAQPLQARLDLLRGTNLASLE
jgi:murein DD-endopeptidase MepM/ murein hydrolase activator NlpD